MDDLRLCFDSFDVSARIDRAKEHRACLVFAHGAGAGMLHSTLEQIASKCTQAGISIVRFNFPYMEAKKNRTDAQPVATLAIKSALELAQSELTGPYYLGGHSFGGRMSTHAVVDHDLDVEGLILCSFPLHTPKNVHTKRADHLDEVKVPMLFLSGTRDGMANKELMEGVVSRVEGTLHWLDTADHGYKVLKRTRTRTDDVFDEMIEQISLFVDKLAP